MAEVRQPHRPTAPATPRDAGATAARGRQAIHTLLQFALALLIFAYAAGRRVLDADEGHFLSAIRAVYEGRVPYQDFFYQQTPLFLYPYAWAMRLFGYGYDACLWVSLISGAGLAAVTSAWFARRGGSAAIGWVGGWLVVTNAQLFFWVPTVKNHALPLFCGAAALWAASIRSPRPRGAFGWGALAGFAAVCCVGSRLPALPLAAAAGGWVLLRAIAPDRPRGAWLGIVGLIAGALPPLALALRSLSPDAGRAWFDVIEFHQLRSAGGAYGTLQTVLRMLDLMAGQIQFPLLALGAFAAAVGQLMKRFVVRIDADESDQPETVTSAGAPLAAAAAHKTRAVTHKPEAAMHEPEKEGNSDDSSIRPHPNPLPPGEGEAEWIEPLLTVMAVAATILQLLPRQTFVQYFMVPLVLIWFATPRLWKSLLVPSRPIRIAAGIGLLLVHGALYFNARERIFPDCWRLARARELAAAMKARTAPGDVVFTTWQGFSFLAERPDIPGNENFNAHTIARRIGAEQRRRLHVADHEELKNMLAGGLPKAIAIGFFAGLGPDRDPSPFYFDILFDGYDRRSRGGELKIWLRPEIARHYEKVELPNQGYHELWVRRE